METSEDLYNQILRDGPSPKTLFLLLKKLKEEGQLNRVIQEALKALQIYPNDIHIRRLLAEAYFEAGRLSQAEAELEKVTQLMGDLTDVFRLQAEIFLRQKRTGEAEEVLKRYLALRPDDHDARILLDSLRPPEEAPPMQAPSSLEQLSVAGEKGPSEAPEQEGPEIATSTLAEIYVNQGQIQEAIKTYEAVLFEHPEDQACRQRLKVLKGELRQQELQREETERLRKRKEEMVATLELWLANIRERFKPAQP